MKDLVQAAFRLISSLQLTILGLVLGMVLIFFGTLDQIHLGIWAAQAKYFRSFIVFWSSPVGDWSVPIMPGGYLVGSVLMVNLVAAHFARYRLSWKKLGITITHLGIVLLLVGELLSGVFQRDFDMVLDEGQTKNYSEANREIELVIIERTDPDVDRVVSLPEGRLLQGGTIQHPSLPFTVDVQAFYPNARIFQRGAGTPPPGPLANKGIGANHFAMETARVTKDDERDLTTAIVQILDSGNSLGTWMTCNAFEEIQSFEHEGRTFVLELRQRRFYKPYSITLLDFTHDRYPGTEIPRNFSSLSRLVDEDAGEDREVRIYMNHPLRYAGLTFYQASFANDDRTSILRVVKNPGRHLPYISCILVTVGLLVQFGMHLFAFMQRRAIKA
jgi:hypothetical protein